MGRRRKPAGRMGEGDGAERARARGAITTVSLVGLSLGLALTTVPARAARVDGVSEQNLAHWDDAAFSVSSYSGGYFPSPFRPVLALASAPSRVTLARLVVPWDVMAHVRPENGEGGSNGELDFGLLAGWLEDVKWLGLTPDLAVEHAPAGLARNGAKLPPVVPSSRFEYERYVTALLNYAASVGEPVRYLEAWNEPNDLGVPHPSPARAAEFMNAATSICAGRCTAIAGDFLDSEYLRENASGENAGVAYQRQYSEHLDPGSPAIWGFHPYAAVKYEELRHGQESTITRFESHLPAGGAAVWFTEVGAYYCERGGGYPAGGQGEKEARQRKNAEYLNELINRYYTVEHVFYYELSNGYGVETNCARSPDTSLYDHDDRPRAAAEVVLGAAAPAPPVP